MPTRQRNNTMSNNITTLYTDASGETHTINTSRTSAGVLQRHSKGMTELVKQFHAHTDDPGSRHLALVGPLLSAGWWGSNGAALEAIDTLLAILPAHLIERYNLEALREAIAQTEDEP
jgi:hypothetical protein